MLSEFNDSNYDSGANGFTNPGGTLRGRILGMLSLTVKTADDLLANCRLLRRIGGIHHAFRQAG